MPLVLIVEPEAKARASLGRALAKLAELELAPVASVPEARARIAERPPALVLAELDVRGAEALVATLDQAGVDAPLVLVGGPHGVTRERGPVIVRSRPLLPDALRSLVLDLVGTQKELPPPFGLEEYVQIATLGGHSVSIQVFDGPTPIGRVVVQEGALWRADDEHGGGELALARLMFEPSTRVTCEDLTEDPGERNLDAPSFDGLVLELARRRDEGELRPRRPRARTPTPRPGGVVHGFDDLFDRGLAAIVREDFADAVRCLERAQRMRPGDERVELHLRRLRELGY